MFTPANLPQDYFTLRECYEGDDNYLRRNVIRLSETESESDYQRRIQTSPSPCHTREKVDRVLDALVERLRWCVRYGQLVSRVTEDNGPGIEAIGTSVNQFVTKLAKELLIVGRVGVLVSNNRDVQTPLDLESSRPFCKTILAESIVKFEPAPSGSPSAYSVVELKLADDETIRFWLDESGNVRAKVLPEGEDIDMRTDRIPVVIVEHPSLVSRVFQTQKSLTNLLSVLSSNSPDLLTQFMARQRDLHNIGSSLRSEPNGETVGRQRGIWYDKGLEVPSYVSPEAAATTEARQIVEALENDIERLCGFHGESDNERKQSLANVVGALGETLLNAERQIWSHLGSYASVTDAPVVRYPATWIAQSETERLADVAKRFEIAQQFYGRKCTEIAAVDAVEQALAGRSSKELEAAVASVKSARCLATDLTTIVRAGEAGKLDIATVADSFACLPEVAEAALAEDRERMKQLALATAAATATKPTDSVGTDRDAQLAEKRLSQAEGEGGTRGENQ